MFFPFNVSYVLPRKLRERYVFHELLSGTFNEIDILMYFVGHCRIECNWIKFKEWDSYTKYLWQLTIANHLINESQTFICTPTSFLLIPPLNICSVKSYFWQITCHIIKFSCTKYFLLKTSLNEKF